MSLSKRIILTVRDYSVRLSSPIKLYQNDQLHLIFEINKYGIDVNGGDNQHETIMPINPLKANLFFETPLGTDSLESAEITDNTVVFHLESKHTQYIGISKMQIQLIDEECCQITLPDFPFEIRENIYDNAPLLQAVLLSDENDNLLVDENNVALSVGTEVISQTYAVAATSLTSDITTKQIKDYNLDTNITGIEDILVQDSGVTKRVKVSGLINSAINLEEYYTKNETENLIDNALTTNYYTKDEVEEEINEGVIFTTDMTTISSLGGISAGTDLNNLTVQEVLRKLLFPYIAPTLSASLTYTPTGTTFECGETVEITKIIGSVIKKSESISNIKFLDDSTILYENTVGVNKTATYTYNFSTPISITSDMSNTRFRFSVTDATNKTYYANTTTFKFYRPYYYGVIDGDVVVTNDLVVNLTKKVEAKGTKTNYYTTNNQRMLIAYPKSYGTLTKIFDANSFDVTATFTKTEINILCLDNTLQSYYVYTNEASTVNNFKMTFQY